MTPNEYSVQIKRLERVFPKSYSSEDRVELIYKYTYKLEIEWFQRIVDKMILNMDPRFDFQEAANIELRRRREDELKNTTLETYDELQKQMSKNGLDDVLRAMEAKSLLHAIEKSIVNRVELKVS